MGTFLSGLVSGLVADAMNDRPEPESWFDDYAGDQDENQIDEYDLPATPGDSYVSTIYNFIRSGAVKIPGFQRNFV